ncbi:hypothetical protein MFLAVUS_005340 [Mucor flavus]|uniref:Uncharacterized protein n=1 Tax=Mucor flavus TaxID=439312 RepID=A0ABP9YYG3_9FUNG
MIPSVWAILIYQVLAFLGIDAVSQIVTYVAYKKQDLDTKLMYNQDPLDLLCNYNKFRKPFNQKLAIILTAIVALLIGFIPTVFTKLNQTGYIYSDPIQLPLQQSQLPWSNTSMPVINDFLRFLRNSTSADQTSQDILTTYLMNNLNQNVTKNPSGTWFDVDLQPKNDYFNDHQGTLYGFQTAGNATFLAFGFRPSDSSEPTSETLSSCILGSNTTVTRFDSFLGFMVGGLVAYDNICYPMYDRTAAIYRRNQTQNKISLLSANDYIYRPPQLSPGGSAMGSFGVSLYNHNSTHMNLGIKKMASITMYNYNKTVPLPTDCDPEGKTENATTSFKNLANNKILCQLMSVIPSQSNTTMRILQASRKYYDGANHATNAVYTTIKSDAYERYELGQAVLIDLNMFAAYTIKGQLADDKEYLLASEDVKLGGDVYAENSALEITLENNNIDYILDKLDDIVLDEQTINTLITLASARVRWSNGYFSDFVRYTADVTDAIETPNGWIISVVVILVIFLVPQALRLLLRHDNYYSQDLRGILISTLEDKNVGPFETENRGKARRVDLVLLSQGEGVIDASISVDGDIINTNNDFKRDKDIIN